ncbi:MAG: 23S rRNA (guanosine(2251)-2'-O)-methyltransferase RlmB [Kiritimatiellae bacterium]|nr:23S rRNA (guanosine(2251)-2'-O)-methyltransferase RlmB [Kiritimatiellia bacterium]
MSKPRWEYIYGINPAFEVVRSGRRELYGAFLNKKAMDHPRLKKLNTLLQRKNVPVEWVEKGRVFDLAQSKEHQGVVLKTSPYVYASFEPLLERERLLLLDNIEDPHNVGAVIRCADVFGYNTVLLPLKGTPEVYPSIVKVSAGATEHLDIAKETSANNYVKKTIEHGYKIVALDMKGTTTFHALRLEKIDKVMLVIGGEATAVGQFILNHADYTVRIHQHGKINSLNASVAAGIAMFMLGTQDT